MQGLFSWHCRGWKDVRFFQVGIENIVYERVIVIEMTELWLLHLHTLLVRKVVLKCQHTITYTTYRTHSKLIKFSYKYGGLNKGN